MDILNYDFDTLFFLFLGVVIVILFILMIVNVIHNLRFLSERRRDLMQRVGELRLSKMLLLQNIPLKKYFEKTSDVEKSRHIWACERCPNSDECNQALAGEDLDAQDFCPNYPRLKGLKPDK